MPAWYALYTRHQHERAIAAMLAGKGFEIFLPLSIVVHHWKDRRKTVVLPVFPCYVFLRGGLGGGVERRSQVVSTPGVYSFVGAGGHPAVIPQPEIDAIRRTVDAGVGIEPHPFLKSGDWVRVITGPLEGIEGVLVRQKGLCRLVLSVELLQKSVAVEVEAEAVEKITTRRPWVGVGSGFGRFRAWA
ncbi:MAG TPA: UpxY family transcription antiterminator [Terriglobia bacterium]|nr:UpxY family transcription antiterminator [Terriglobia bacterium]